MERTPMEEGNHRLDSNIHHSGNQVIIVRNALFVHWSVSKGKESWPNEVSKCARVDTLDTHQENEGEKYGTPKAARRVKSCLYV
jgi:hypothetical protein